MRSLCQFSTRWHPHFYQVPIRSGQRACSLRLPPPITRTYRQVAGGRRGRLKVNPVKRDVIVQEFEQLGDNASTRRLADPRTQLRHDEEALVEKINELEQELAIMKEGPFGPNSEFIQSLPKEYRAQALKELDEAGLLNLEEGDILHDSDFDEALEKDYGSGVDYEEEQQITRPSAVTLRIPQRQQEYVKRFNTALANVNQNEESLSAHIALWQWYLRCQEHVANFSNVIPEDVWQILWDSVLNKAYRPKHVILLVKDMSDAEINLEKSHIMAYIEALFTEDDTAQALAYWKQQQGQFLEKSSLREKYWTLGVKLYAALGRPKKAQEVAVSAIRDGSMVDGQIFVPVISAWASSKDLNAAEKIWSCYLQLRTLMEDRMTIILFQQISSALLQSGHADIALAVFKDMLALQEQTSDDSTDIYRRAVDHFQDVQSRAITEDQINRIGLSALIIFPKRFQNKFFFGSWIKMLIGRGEVDAAATVVELMHERGVKLDAKHLNGIVGAWLRDGSHVSRQKAESLAWAMINARIDFVKERQRRDLDLPEAHQASSISTSRMTSQEISRRLPRFVVRAAPLANIETFSILILHHTRRSDMLKAEELTRVMTGPAAIRPNSFIMNHWLYSDLRSSDIQGVWNKYSNLKHDIRPDLETFAALWDAAKVQYDSSRIATAKFFPSARQLFAEMISWIDSLSEKLLNAVRNDFSRDLYETIIRTFQLSSDMNGLLCAMYELKTRLDLYPDINTTRTVTLLVSRSLPVTSQSGPPRMRQRRAHLQRSLKLVSEILDAVAQQRQINLVQQGVDLDNLDPESQISKQAQLDILSDFILTVLQRRQVRDGDVQNEVKTVAKVMKVDINPIDFECLKAAQGNFDQNV